MKKIWIVSLFLLTVGSLAAADRFSLSLQGQGILPHDQNYTEVYGRVTAGLDARFTWQFLSTLHLWLGTGWTPGFGRIPDLDDLSFSSQLSLLAGFGWRPRLWKRLIIDLHMGVAWIFYSERAMGISTAGGAPGLLGGLEFEWLVKKKFYILLASDFIYSRDEYGDREIYPGGTRLGLGIGWVF